MDDMEYNYMIVLFLFLALSNTSFPRVRGLDNEDFSLDEGNDEVDTTATLLNNARQSVNIADKTGKRSRTVEVPRRLEVLQLKHQILPGKRRKLI